MSQTAQDKLGLESECFNMGPEKGSQVMAGLLVEVILVLGPGGHVGPLSNVLEMAGLASCPKKAASGPGLFFFLLCQTTQGPSDHPFPLQISSPTFSIHV